MNEFLKLRGIIVILIFSEHNWIFTLRKEKFIYKI